MHGPLVKEEKCGLKPLYQSMFDTETRFKLITHACVSRWSLAGVLFEL